MRCVSFSSFEFRTQRKRFPCMDILHQERILLALARDLHIPDLIAVCL